MKRVLVLMAGQSGDEGMREVEIERGVTAGDVVRELGLPNSYALSRHNESQPFAPDEELYDAVADGSKLRCMAHAGVGVI